MSSVRRVFRSVAPIIGAIGGTLLAPGIGTALGSKLGAGALGAIGGAIGGGIGGGISGGGLQGVGLGALGGAAFGGAGALGSAAGSGLGVTSQAGLSALTSGIQGAGLGLATGSPTNALTGAVLGGVGGYLNPSTAGLLGNTAGTSLETVSGVAGAQGPTLGSGLAGAASGGGLGSLATSLGSLTNAGTGGQPMSLGSLLSTAGNLYGGYQGQDDLEAIQRMMAQRSGQAQQLLQPYTQAGETALANMQAPSMEALQNDPGYQFRLQEGQRALERSQAARGGLYSGAALRAAQEYGQGLADQTYNDYFRRQGILANQGLGAAGGLGSLYTNLASAQAAAEIARMNQRNQMYSGLGGLVGGLFG